MILLRLLLLFGVPALLGISVLSFLIGKEEQRKNGEKLLLLYPLGLGILIVLMFFLAWFGLPLTVTNLSLSALIVALATIPLSVKLNLFPFSLNRPLRTKNKSGFFPRFNWLETLLIAALTVKVGYLTIVTIIKPLVDVDAFQFYSIVAKAIFRQHTFLGNYLEQFISDKPLFAYLSQGWSFLALGSTNDALFKIINPILLVCFLGLFYFLLRRYLSRPLSLLFTFLLAALPLLAYHVTTAYADFPATVYYALSTIYLFVSIDSFSKDSKTAFADCALSMAFLGIAVWTKRAVLATASVNLLVFSVFLIISKNQVKLKGKIKPLITAFLPFLLLAGPWIVLGQKWTLLRIASSIANTSAAALPANFPAPNFGIITAIIANKLFLYGSWQLLFGLLTFTLICFWRTIIKNLYIYLLAIFLLDLLLIGFQFRSPEMFHYLLDGTLLDRLIMNLAPIALFFLAVVLGKELTLQAKGNSEADQSRAYVKKQKGSGSARKSRD